MEPLKLNTFVRLVVEIVFGRMGVLKTTAVWVSEGNNKVKSFILFFYKIELVVTYYQRKITICAWSEFIVS